MSSMSATEISKEIQAIDQAIRQALQDGTISEEMDFLRKRIKALLSAHARAKAEADGAITKLFQESFFFERFYLEWKAKGDSDDLGTFIRIQLKNMVAFDSKYARTLAVVSDVASACSFHCEPLHQSLWDVPGSQVIQQEDSPKTADRHEHSMLLSRQKIADKNAEAEAMSEETSESKESSSEEEDDKKATKNVEDKMVHSTAPEALDRGAKKRVRVPPVIDDSRTNHPPCPSCVKKGIDCHPQAKGRGACGGCNLAKIQCAGDRVAWNVEREEAKSAAMPMPMPIATLKPSQRPKPKLKALLNELLNAQKRKLPPEADSDGDGLPTVVQPRPKPKRARMQTPVPVAVSTPAAPSHETDIGMQRDLSPPHFSALEKGKGKEKQAKPSANDETRQDDLPRFKVLDLQDRLDGLENGEKMDIMVAHLGRNLGKMSKPLFVPRTRFKHAYTTINKVADDVTPRNLEERVEPIEQRLDAVTDAIHSFNGLFRLVLEQMAIPPE